MSKNLFLANGLLFAIRVFIFPPAIYSVAQKPKKEKYGSRYGKKNKAPSCFLFVHTSLLCLDAIPKNIPPANI
jgi:hypothetical protein